MLKVSAFYPEKQKKNIPKKEYFLSHCQYQNKKALFTDPIFSEGFDSPGLLFFTTELQLRVKSYELRFEARSTTQLLTPLTNQLLC